MKRNAVSWEIVSVKSVSTVSDSPPAEVGDPGDEQPEVEAKHVIGIADPELHEDDFPDYGDGVVEILE